MDVILGLETPYRWASSLMEGPAQSLTIIPPVASPLASKSQHDDFHTACNQRLDRGLDAQSIVDQPE